MPNAVPGSTKTLPVLQPESSDEDTELPPRVVVQLPDGDVCIGEDQSRLQHEQFEAIQQPSLRRGAQPGTEQWLDFRRLLYATALDAVSLKRKRYAALLLAIDMVYMAMSIAGFVLAPSTNDTDARFFKPKYLVIMHVLAGMLDCLTLLVVLKERRKLIRFFSILHGFMLVQCATAARRYIPLGIIRMLIVSFLARLLASLVELDWVVGARPLSGRPRPVWLQSLLLGVQLQSLKNDYVRALALGATFGSNNSGSSPGDDREGPLSSRGTMPALRLAVLHDVPVPENTSAVPVSAQEPTTGHGSHSAEIPAEHVQVVVEEGVQDAGSASVGLTTNEQQQEGNPGPQSR